MVMGMANLAMATGNIGRVGVGVNPLRGQNNVQGSCDMGSFPHEYLRLPACFERRRARAVRGGVGRAAAGRAGLAHPQHVRRRASKARSKGSMSRARTSRSPIRTPSTSQPGCSAMECVVVQDLFLNETASYAHVFLPGSSFLEKDGTFTNAERRISRVRKGDPADGRLADWEVTMRALERAGLPDALQPSVRNHGRDRAPHADLRRRVLSKSSTSWAACSGRATTRRPKARRSCISADSCAARAGS